MLPAAISHHFPGFPTISRHFPDTPPPRIAGILDIGFMDASPCRATVLACMSHQAAMRSPGGSRDTNQAFPHRPRQTGATRSRRPAVPPAAQSLLACALWSGCGAGGAAVVVRVERLGAAWSGILPLNQCPRSVRRSRLPSLRTPKEPMLRKRNVLYSADIRAVSVAGILPSEYNGRTAAAKGMCI